MSIAGVSGNGQRTLAEVKDEIKADLAEQRATDTLAKLMDDMQEKLASGESLDKAAASLQLPLRSSELFAKENPPVDLRCA